MKWTQGLGFTCHPVDVAKQFQLPVLYQVDYGTMSFCFFSNSFVTDSVSPAHFQNSPVTPHLKCQEFSGVRYFDSPCLSSVEQMGKHTRYQHINLSCDYQLAATPQCL